MAKKWMMTHEQTEVGFEVLSVAEAKKPGYAVVSVKYPTSETIYTYVRKAVKQNDLSYKTIVDGCTVYFDGSNYKVLKTERIYDTSGMRKENNPGGASKSTVKKIKDEIEDNNVIVPSIVVPSGEIHHEKYETIKMCLECNIPVYLAGPAGSGKNHTVEQIAKELGWDFYFSNSVQQEHKLTGFIDAGGKFHDTEFYKACNDDNNCIFFLDEIDASIPEVLVLLNTAIANGYFEFPNGRVDLKYVHFVAAGNTVGSGADEMYTGRMVLDQATLDRFAIIEFDYDVRIEMTISKGNSDLVAFIHSLRDDANAKGIRATFSYRCITMVTKLEKSGMDIESIIKIAIVKGLDKDTINTLNPIGNTKYNDGLKKVQKAA